MNDAVPPSPPPAPPPGLVGFRRARRPEQREARRQAILDAAAAMLAQRPVHDISLRELACRVGLAKSNVLRYFETREAVFLELLDVAWRQWLDDLETRLNDDARVDGAPAGRRVAVAVAYSLAAVPLLCELISVTASVLERNISTEVAVRFKLAAVANTDRLAVLVRAQLPELSALAAHQFAGLTFVLTAGLWPLANPAGPVLAALEHPHLQVARLVFDENLRDALVAVLAGLPALDA